jgi:SAM-dependent methyltransferase
VPFANDSDKSWEYIGKNDPYWGVLALEEYSSRNLTEDSKERFFESGAKHISLVLGTIRECIVPTFKPKRALDFGCGVGRLVIPLSSVCDSVVGVDVSESMLKEAQSNCRLRAITNVEFVRSNDRLSEMSGSFDFIHSFLVFQHIPYKRGEMIFRRLIDLLQEDGVGALHFMYRAKLPYFMKLTNWPRMSIPVLNGLVNLFRGRPFSYPFRQMNEYDLGRLFRILQESNCDRLHLSLTYGSTATTSYYGAMIFFQKRRLENQQRI